MYVAAVRRALTLYIVLLVGGPLVSHVTIEVEVVGLNLARKSFLQIDRPKERERELENSTPIDERRKLKSDNAEPYAL